MNQRIIKHGLDSGMLNYVDHETPRHYFLSAHADEECLEKFAQSIIAECLYLCESTAAGQDAEAIQAAIQQHFGVKF
jgi:hypothetical protein